MDDLTNDNFLICAAKCYDSPVYVTKEFEEDIKRFHYLNRLFNRYLKHGELKERLILNHIVILTNIFTPEVAVRFLFFKIQPRYHHILKTFLLFLNIMKDKIEGINGSDILSSQIEIDFKVVEVLKEVRRDW